VEDYNAAGDGGDSDEEGDGFEVVESMAECTSTHERATNDHDEIEANVSDSIDNCVYSNVTDALPKFVTLDGAPEGWVPPKPNEKYNPNAAWPLSCTSIAHLELMKIGSWINQC
jgi:hypothetical protein